MQLKLEWVCCWEVIVERCGQVMASKAGVDIANVKHSVNPFCEIAVEVIGNLTLVLMRRKICSIAASGSPTDEGGRSPI